MSAIFSMKTVGKGFYKYMTKVVKQSRGRPPKSGHGYSVVMRIRKEFDKALELLDDRDTPLHEILARELEAKPQDTLRAISQFMPRQVDMQVNAEASYLDALKSVQSALNDQIDARTLDCDISATVKPDVIDIED